MSTAAIIAVAIIAAIVILGLAFVLVIRDAARRDYVITGTVLSFRIAKRVPKAERAIVQPASKPTLRDAA